MNENAVICLSARDKMRSYLKHPGSFVLMLLVIPNRPYTIDGIPDRVSVVRRITSINLFPLPAYSTRKTAEKIPNGTAISKESRVITTVLTNAGITEAFSDV